MMAGVYMSDNNWQERHAGQEQRKIEIRNRIQEAGKIYAETRKNFRPATMLLFTKIVSNSSLL